MADPVCAKCSKPILATENKFTVDQVDACTMAVERVTYHSECSDREPGGPATSIACRTSSRARSN